MLRQQLHDSATSNVLAWSNHAANIESATEEEAGADADEPPDSKTSPEFRRTWVAKPRENHASLLTRALQSASEGEATENITAPLNLRRRRSINSEISLASTADLTSDTGLSTPARTSTPSPRLPHIGLVPLTADKHHGTSGIQIVGSVPTKVAPTSDVKNGETKDSTSSHMAKDPAIKTIEKKRCISFACTAKPSNDAPKAPTPAPAPAAQPAPQPAPARKTCIKFACPARPGKQQSPAQSQNLEIPKIDDSGSLSTVINASPYANRKGRSPGVSRPRPSSWKTAKSPGAPRKRRYITAKPSDLQGEICHFHEFASDHPTEDDWIRQEKCLAKAKLTMDDLLKKENAIRRLGKEAEEEAEQEEAEDDDEADEDDDGDNVDGEDDIEEEEEIEEDEQSGYGSDDDFSDGYNTDEEYGFADSDDEVDDGLHLWTFNNAHHSYQTKLPDATPVFRRPSLAGQHSDSSTYSRTHIRAKHSKSRSIPNRPVTPELPDSTDFVCGTMDEDRPLEEAYLTRLAARKQEKLRIIPQDIDPSFPTSEPEDNDEEDPKHSHDSGEQVWLHGELEDLGDERVDRRHRKNENASPKRLRSPPPTKRYRSPPPKARGRSPRRFGASPKRAKSPAPAQLAKSPNALSRQARREVTFKAMASRPGLTHTKSLPRGGYVAPHIKSGKRTKTGTTKHKGHIRGAIDIVKGLEQKRQRRKEKFYQKYCNRARKGQIPEKKAQPGEGAERMRELGLILAGKIGQGNYVMSI